MSFGICVPQSILLPRLAVGESLSPSIRSLGRPSIRLFHWDCASTIAIRHATKHTITEHRKYYYFVCLVEVIPKMRIFKSWRCVSLHWILIYWKIDARQSAESRCHCRRCGLQYISRRDNLIWRRHKTAMDRNKWNSYSK